MPDPEKSTPPLPGADYEEYAIPSDCPADYAVRLTGDSMEPWLHDGDILLVERRIDLRDGDVGIFHTAEGLVFRQFCRDSAGNIHLFSLNRARRDADVFIPEVSGRPVTCYGRVLLDVCIPLPTD